MTRRTIQDEPWDDEPDEDWGSEELGLNESDEGASYTAADNLDDELDGGEPTIPCPYCRCEIHEDSLRCPYCDQYISREDAAPSRKSWFIVVGTLVTLYILYRWVFH